MQRLFTPFIKVHINVGDYAKSCRDVSRRSIRIWVLLKTENGVVKCSSCHLKNTSILTNDTDVLNAWFNYSVDWNDE